MESDTQAASSSPGLVAFRKKNYFILTCKSTASKAGTGTVPLIFKGNNLVPFVPVPTSVHEVKTTQLTHKLRTMMSLADS